MAPPLNPLPLGSVALTPIQGSDTEKLHMLQLELAHPILLGALTRTSLCKLRTSCGTKSPGTLGLLPPVAEQKTEIPQTK